MIREGQDSFVVVYCIQFYVFFWSYFENIEIECMFKIWIFFGFQVFYCIGSIIFGDIDFKERVWVFIIMVSNYSDIS